MRNLPPRPAVKAAIQKQLKSKTQAIVQITDLTERRAKARRIYESSRKSYWFRPIIEALRKLSGNGELCMYCSANEPSQVEHYRPLSVFPEYALQFDNYLWTCDICNRTYKQERFPPDTEPGEQILNPLDDNVWDYFFLDDQFGRLIKRLDVATKAPLPRAVTTCDVVGIDRQNVQIRRQHRFKRLRETVQAAVDQFQAGALTQADLQDEIAELRAEPFQADVADYFLNGPGRAAEPFRSALIAAEEMTP